MPQASDILGFNNFKSALNTHKIQLNSKETPNPLPVPGSGPGPGPDPDLLLMSALTSHSYASAVDSSFDSQITSPHENILLSFDSDNEEDNDRDVESLDDGGLLCQGNILVNFDSDRDGNVNFRGVVSDLDIETDADDEDDEDDAVRMMRMMRMIMAVTLTPVNILPVVA